MRELRTRQAVERYDSLGAVTVAQLITRDLATASPAEIVATVKTAPNHRQTAALIASLAMAELTARVRGGDIAAERELAEVQKLIEPPEVQKLQRRLLELDATEREIAAWHPDRNEQLKARFGVK